MNLIETLNWRYAAKRMTSEKVPAEKVDEIVEAIRLSASSAGMQPYKVIVVENPEIKAKLQAASFNPQVSESSHLLVFAAYDSVKQQHIDEYIDLIVKTREVPAESMDTFKSRLGEGFLSFTPEQAFNWASRQAYIALGTAIIAAANLKVDSTPMEGFAADQFDEILGLREKGLKSVVLLALGYRDEANDPLANMKKVRMPKEQLTHEIA